MIDRKSMKPSRLEIVLTYSCSNSCSFCLEADNRKMEDYHLTPFSPIEIFKILKYKKSICDFVNFTGGEPTLYPNFSDVVKKARRLGYRVVINTNGLKFSQKKFAQETLPSIDEIVLSLHGHTAKIHEKHTRKGNSFENALLAINNIEKLKPNCLLVNVVVTKANFVYLKNILNFLNKLGVNNVLLSNVAPSGGAKAGYAEQTISIEKWRKEIPKLVSIVQKKNMRMKIFGLPACAMPKQLCYLDEGSEDARQPLERIEKKNNKIGSELVYRFGPERKKVSKCKRCSLTGNCLGLFSDYNHIFGSKELIKN
jgi:MoaA/NifB/PqqE/SkfB family radical SAM enzyme